jgi:preprotein translocase subunit SecY
MSVFLYIKNVLKSNDFLYKLGFTLFILFVYRIGMHIPIPGINLVLLKDYMQNSGSLASSIFSFIDIFSGGSLSTCALFALGISPAISASIIMQFLGFSVPYLEMLNKEGEYGKAIIGRYTRKLSLAISVVQALGYAFYLESFAADNIVFAPGLKFKLFFTICMVAGSMFVMWLGDQIKVVGIGNGSSMIIFAGIVAKFPDYCRKIIVAVTAQSLTSFLGVLILIIFCILTAAIVFLEKGERKLSVFYAKRIIENKVFGGQNSFIPFKINTVGVIPVIFATSMLSVPKFIFGILSKFHLFSWLSTLLLETSFLYNFLLFALIIFFTYIYTALAFNPDDLANNLKQSGGFLQNIRPGKSTANYFAYILVRIGFVGALYLGLLAILPNMITIFIPSIPFHLSGTSMLIVVGVALDFITQVRSYVLEHRYDSFLPNKKIINNL